MTVATVQTLTHSRLACFRACPRRHYLRYELGLSPEVTEFSLRVGNGFHAAQEARDKGQDVEAAMDAAVTDPYDLALIACMVGGHETMYRDEPLQAVAAELPFDLPLVNPDTGAASPLFRMAGVIDRIVRLPDGRLALMEYKTTSRDFSPDADYWTYLHRDQQLSIYVIAARALGYDVSTVVYDVTRRPAQRPSQVALRDAEGFKIVHDSAGQRVRTKDGKKWRETADAESGYVLQTRQETPEEYAERVGAAIASNPHHYFARIEIARMDDDLAACQSGVWQQMQALRAMQRAGPAKAMYANPGACFSPHPCAYLGICSRTDLDVTTPAGFVRVDDLHPELSRGAASDPG